jgi:hypothetical protein
MYLAIALILLPLIPIYQKFPESNCTHSKKIKSQHPIHLRFAIHNYKKNQIANSIKIPQNLPNAARGLRTLLLLLSQNINIGFFVRVIRVKILVRNLLDIKHGLAQVPEELVGLRGSELVAEQNDAVVGHKGLHGGHERAHGLLDVNDVGGDDVVEGRVKGLDLVGVVPVEDGVLEGFGEDGFVALEVAFQRGHHGGYVGQYQVGESQEVETHAGGPASGTQFHGALAAEVEEVGVGVVVVVAGSWSRGWGGGGWGPAVSELDENERAGPHGGADVEGAVVLLDGKEGVAHGELDFWGVCELHFLCRDQLLGLTSNTVNGGLQFVRGPGMRIHVTFIVSLIQIAILGSLEL